MRALVTGGAGFIGSNLVGELLQRGWSVRAADNLLLGRVEFIEPFMDNERFHFVECDLLEEAAADDAVCGVDAVFHLAANSDISYGARHTDTDLKLGTVVTFNVLEAMRRHSVGKIVFSSTSAVYGDTGGREVAEDSGPLLPISLYGASKLACEGLVSAFCHNFGIQAWIYRFANIVGDNGTHGVLVDFIHKLTADADELVILGDGKQSKPYLYVKDCVSGMLFGFDHARGAINCFNLTCEGSTNVTRIAELVVEGMGLRDVRLRFTGGSRGWRGDVPQVRLSPERMASLGWTAPRSSDEAVRAAVAALVPRMAGGVSCRR